MTDRITLRMYNAQQGHAAMRQAWAAAKNALLAGHRLVLDVRQESRSLKQNAPREINEAWKKMAEAAIAANDGVAEASLKAQAQQHGFAIQTDEAGKSIVKTMQEAQEATQKVGEEAAKAGERMKDAAEDASRAWGEGDLLEQARAHNETLRVIETSWLDAQAAASQYAQEMAAVVWQAGKALSEMRAEHAALVEQMETLAAQQRQIEAVNNDAVRGLEDLRLRYLELTGDQEAAAALKAQMARQEIDLKLALLEIDLQRAQLAGDESEVKKFELQIAALKEQITWLDKIHAKEKELRKERAREDGGSSRGGSRSGGGMSMPSAPAPAPTPVSTPSAPAPAVNITLNANGINDPVRLAKMIEPELKRMARLAR